MPLNRPMPVLMGAASVVHADQSPRSIGWTQTVRIKIVVDSLPISMSVITQIYEIF
jgi:hypothetical protein